MDEQFLKELRTLQELLKSTSELQHQKIQSLTDLLQAAEGRANQAVQQNLELKELLEEVIAEKDVQISRLMKAVSALTVISEQLTARFNVQE